MRSHKAFINTFLITNRLKLSATAKAVFIELACTSSPEHPHVMIDAQFLAQNLNKSVSTIKKAVRELLRLGLLVFENIIIQLKNKIYKLIFNGGVALKEAVKKNPCHPRAGGDPGAAAVQSNSKDPLDSRLRGNDSCVEKPKDFCYPPPNATGPVAYDKYMVPEGRVEEFKTLATLLLSIHMSNACALELFATKGFTRLYELVKDYGRYKQIYGAPLDVDNWFRAEGKAEAWF